MADHHIDSIPGFDYSKAAEMILKRHGLYIHGAPPINHKPGNDFISDVYYPHPLYPDYRFRNPSEENLDIKFPPDPPEPEYPTIDEDGKDFQFIPEELEQLKHIKNPMISYTPDDREHFIDKSVSSYTGLVLQAVEKRAFDISYVKPYFKDKKIYTKLIVKEVVSGHTMSIATYDGWKYHIYRGRLVTVVKTEAPKSENGKKLRPVTSPFGTVMEEVECERSDTSKLLERNIHLVLDVSDNMEAEIVSVPINQVIDIQKYDAIYNFSIYESGLKVFWDDWFTVKDHEKNDETWFIYAPHGDLPPQTLYHEVIEHQKVQRQRKINRG